MTGIRQQTGDRTQHRLGRVGVCVCVVSLVLLTGCKSDKEPKGMGVSRGHDPLVKGPNLIPRQNVPIPDRATGPKSKPDPLVTPTGGKASYSDDSERFKGPVVLGPKSTPAALAGRLNDGDELKINDGVPLRPTQGSGPDGVLAGGPLEAPQNLTPLYAQLEKMGVKSEDRLLEREGGKWVFRASVPKTAEGAKTQYTEVGTTAAEAVRKVIDRIAEDRR